MQAFHPIARRKNQLRIPALRIFSHSPRGSPRKLLSSIEGLLINDGGDIIVLVKSSTVLSKICFQSLNVFIVELPQPVPLEMEPLEPDASGSLVLDAFFCLDSRLVLSNLSSPHLDKLRLVEDRNEEDT